MAKYYFENKSFVIEDFQNAKRFCSFFPAVAGVDGKPLWAFYANVGQCMGGFGVGSKETPMTPFDSATLAYQNIPTKSFRTFLRVDNEEFAPFFDKKALKRVLRINRTNFSIEEISSSYSLKITYSTISHKDYPALIRKVEFKNLTDKKHHFEICDGLPIFFPYGLSNFCYKELVSLMGAYCQVDLNKNAPFIRFKTSTGDNSQVALAKEGNAFVSITRDDKRLSNVVELAQIFGNDTTLIEPRRWNEKPFKYYLDVDQQLENQLPSAFSVAEFDLEPNKDYSFISMFGYFKDIEHYNASLKKISYASLDKEIDITEEAVDSELIKGIKTSNPLFDEYIVQSYLDNGLRGGFPLMIGDKPYYVYSRKHGDMERDYNAFNIPSEYYSSGPGNFRDVNQNRRNDLYFVKDIKDFNIKIFFTLIQVDGQNPLTVKPTTFVLNNRDLLKKLPSKIKEGIEGFAGDFTPGKLYSFLKDNLDDEKQINTLFKEIISSSDEKINAAFGEGYWIDHWTYNVDLLENYVSVYPDKIEELLFKSDYPYFYSKVYVEPRSEKYCLVGDKVRQYGAIDLAKFKAENEKANLKDNETLYLKDQNGKVVQTSLAGKIFNLALVKFSTLDANQRGIEMECEKPGWNDAMNGLPGLFASAMSESIELLRLVNFALETFPAYLDKKIHLLDEQYKLYQCVNSSLDELNSSKITKFEYWDKVTTSREELRKNTHEFAFDSNKEISVKEAYELLKKMKEILSKGIKDAKDIGGGLIPSYIINEVDKYEKLNKVNHLGFEVVKPLHFKTVLIPYFLEASARLAKLGNEYFTSKEYEQIKKSDLRDQKLGIYKTCADIEGAPFEIGRVHAFSKGWLERECDFLHMTYKYLLGLLKAGLYKEFYEEMKVNFVCFMDPSIYGRSPIENSSFVVPTCNLNKDMHGQGQFARLTGANAEVLDMFYLMFLGEKAFSYENNKLVFSPSPKLSKEFFDKNDEVSFPLFKDVIITYHNPKHLDCFKGVKLIYEVNGKKYDVIKGQLALDIRDAKVKKVNIEVLEG